MESEADRQAHVRHRLIVVAIDRFGVLGYDAVGTREIAELADTQMSSIRYHFGGKEQLYLAAAQHIADEITAQLPKVSNDGRNPSDPDHIRAALRETLIGFLRIITAPESVPFSRFIAREQAQPGAAFDVLYQAVIDRLLGRITDQLTALAPHSIDPKEMRLRAIMQFGQILVFRSAHETVLRSTGWSEIDDSALGLIDTIVSDQIDAMADGFSRRM